MIAVGAFVVANHLMRHQQVRREIQERLGVTDEEARRAIDACGLDVERCVDWLRRKSR